MANVKENRVCHLQTDTATFDCTVLFGNWLTTLSLYYSI